MLLYTGIYNPNSLPVKHYRFRLDFNFCRIIALVHIRMSLQYAERQQQHRDRQGQGQLRLLQGPPSRAAAPGSKQWGTSQNSQSVAESGEILHSCLGAAAVGVTPAPRGARVHWDGATGVPGVAHPSLPD